MIEGARACVEAFDAATGSPAATPALPSSPAHEDAAGQTPPPPMAPRAATTTRRRQKQNYWDGRKQTPCPKCCKTVRTSNLARHTKKCSPPANAGSAAPAAKPQAGPSKKRHAQRRYCVERAGDTSEHVVSVESDPWAFLQDVLEEVFGRSTSCE